MGNVDPPESSDQKQKNAEELKQTGNQFFIRHDYEKAIEFYDRAIRIDPDYLDAWHNKRLALVKLGRNEEAGQCSVPVNGKERPISPDLPQDVTGQNTDPVLFTRCSFCHTDCYLPFRCQYCGGLFCGFHRLPFNHACPGLEEWKRQPVPGVGMNYSASGQVHATGSGPGSRRNTADDGSSGCPRCGARVTVRHGGSPPGSCPACGLALSRDALPDPGRVSEPPGAIKNPYLAVVLSIIWPGLGQAYNGQYLKGISIFVLGLGAALVISTFLILIPVLIGSADAYLTSRKMNAGKIPFRNLTARGLALFFIVSLIACIILVTLALPLTQYSKMHAVRSILEDYHETHSYREGDIFVCGDMAIEVWNMLETQNITAIIAIGNVDKSIANLTDINHAWVLAEVSPDQWVALETTGGYLVTSKENPRYYTGFTFRDPKELKEFLSLVRLYQDQISKYNSAVDDYNRLIDRYNQEAGPDDRMALLDQLDARESILRQRSSDIDETRLNIGRLLGGNYADILFRNESAPPGLSGNRPSLSLRGNGSAM
jgi:TM2 domain-containing membrane protein YozV